MKNAAGRKRRRENPFLRRLAGSPAGQGLVRVTRGQTAKAASAIVTILAVLLVIRVLSAWTVPVWFRGEKNSPAAVSNGFYGLPRDSVDVLFLGGSRAEAAYIPQVLYNERGITSYTLCAGDQGLRENYYWLQEALRFQGPKAVVLEAGSLVRGAGPDAARRGLTYMRWSRVKWEAVRAVSGEEEEGGLLSWLFPGLWFHGRWQILSEEDFRPADAVRPDGLMGWSSQYSDRWGLPCAPAQDNEVAADGGTALPEPEDTVWLDRIADLCREKGMHLVVTAAPADDLTIEDHRLLRQICEERELRLFDFGTASLYSRIGYDYAEDQADGQHANAAGARKLTSYMGLVLTQDYGLVSHTAARWEEGRALTDQVLRETRLRQTEDLQTFLDNLTTDRYAVFFMTDGPLSFPLSDEAQRRLLTLGIRTDLTALDGRAWYAVPAEAAGRVFTERTADGQTELEAEGLFRARRSRYTLRSTGEGSPVGAQLTFDGIVCEPPGHGLFITVIDAQRRTVVTEALFSSETGERVR